MKKGHSPRVIIPAVLLLLAATHSAVFLLARGSTGTPGGAGEVRDASYLAPAKSADRGSGGDPLSGSSFARRLRELEESTLSRPDFELARDAHLREWIRRDLRGAMDLLYGTEHRKRYESLARSLHAELAAEIARQPRAVWDWLATRRYGSGGSEVFTLWSRALAAAGQTDVLLECAAQPGAPRLMDRDTVSMLCEKIPPGAAAQLAALRQWIAPPGRSSEVRGPAADYARRMAEDAGANPLPFLASEPDEHMRTIFLEKWEIHALGDLPVAQQAQRLAALPQEYRAAAADAMVHYTRGDTSAAVELINALDTAGLLGDPAGETARALADSALGWVMEDGSTTTLDSVHALQAIRADPLRRDALRDLGLLYNHRAPAPLQDCVDAVPAGPDRDAFLSGVVAHAEMSDEVRAQMLAAIQDPQVAAETRKRRAEIEEIHNRINPYEPVGGEGDAEGNEDVQNGGFVLPE